MLAPDVWVPLAAVARPHGVRGEVRLRLYNEDSDLLLEREEVLVRLPDGEAHEVSVDFARRANDAILMKLHSVDDRDRAGELRGAEVCVRRRDFPALEEGEFYACDVEGATVRVKGRDEPIGKVVRMVEYPTMGALVVDAGGKQLDVPLVDAFVESVDVDAGVVTLVTLEGLE